MKVSIHNKHLIESYPKKVQYYIKNFVPIMREFEAADANNQVTQASDDIFIMAICEVFGELFYKQSIENSMDTFINDLEKYNKEISECIATVYLFHISSMGIIKYRRNEKGILMFAGIN